MASNTDSVPTLADYWAILKRRRVSFLVTFGIIFALCALLAILIAPSYLSTSTILIEQQDIPATLLPSSVSSYADQRLQSVSRRVLTNANLEAVIKKFDLYHDMLNSGGLIGPPTPMPEVIQMMHDKFIALTVLDADVVDPKSGKSVEATIAFQLSFKDKDPQTAQKVATELTSLFLAENIRARTAQATNISSFLGTQLATLQAEVAAWEQKLADFKTANAGSMPELSQLNIQMMDRTDTEMQDVDQRIIALEQQKVTLQGQAAQFLSSQQGVMRTTQGEVVLTPAERLIALQTEYYGLAAKYAPDHPDVVRARKELEALKAQLGGDTNTAADLEARIEAKQAELESAQQRYSPEHPDVKRLSGELAGLKAQAHALPPPSAAVSNDKSMQRAALQQNPAYQQIQANLASANLELQTLARRQADLHARHDQYEKRIGAAPEVERAYLELTRGYDAATAKLHDVQTRQSDAQFVTNLETSQTGERFTVIEPPAVPTEPTIQYLWFIILFLGGVFASMCAIAMAALFEAMDDSVHGRDGIEAIFGSPPLAAIPIIRKGSVKAAALLVTAMSAAMLAVSHGSSWIA